MAERLRVAGAEDVRVQPYRGPRTYAWAHLVHALAGLLGAARGGWRGALLALAALASYELEVSGRRPWTRTLLPRGQGANAIGRIAARGPRRATVVLCAHHDTAHTGLLWHPALARTGAARRLRRRTIDPVGAPAALAALLVATGTRPGRVVGGALHAATAALLVDTSRRAAVPGANDDATGVAVLLALTERLASAPPEGVEVVLVSTGGEEAGMAGMAAALDALELDPATAFVLGLDTLGSGTPIVVDAEATLLPHRYPAAAVGRVVTAAAAAGLTPPERWRIGTWTDPVLARHRGIPATCLLSVGPLGAFTHYHLPSDVPEHVDWGCVERCLAVAEAVVRAA